MSARKRVVNNSQNEKSLEYFDFEQEILGRLMYKCRLGECAKMVNETKTANLVSHLKHVHPKIYIEKINPAASDPKSIALKRLEMVQACAEIVTANGRPFNSLLDSGFQLLIKDKLKELEDNGVPFNIRKNNFRELKEYIEQAALRIESKIMLEIEGKFVSAMSDVVTKNDRAILGTCLRYVHNNEIVTRNIAMNQIEKRHTAANLKELLQARFERLGIKTAQMISFSVDNASNMKKMVEEFNQEAYYEGVEGEQAIDQNNSVFVQCPDMNSNILVTNDPTLEEIIRLIGENDQFEEDDDLDAILNDDDDDYFNGVVSNVETNYAPTTMNVHRIPCAAHTLQLAVKAFLEIAEIDTLVALCRTIAKILHRPTYKYELIEQKIRIRVIRLDCSVRWNFVHRMVIFSVESIVCLHVSSNQFVTDMRYSRMFESH